MQSSSKNVTEALSFFTKLLQIFDIDADDYIIVKKTGDRHLLDGKEIVLYKERIKDTDAHILNPFSEAAAPPPVSAWFYKALRLMLTCHIRDIVGYATQVAVSIKSGEKLEKSPPVLFKELASHLDGADAKMLEEFETMFDNTKPYFHELLTLVYDRRKMETRLRFSIIDDPAWCNATFPKIRKKTITSYANMFKHLFKVQENLDTYAAVAEPNCAPRFTTFMSVSFLVFRAINPYIIEMTNDGVDLTEYQTHLGLMSDYWNIAKHIYQVAPVQQPQQQVQSTNNQYPQQPQLQQRMPGQVPPPKRIDGSIGCAIPPQQYAPPQQYIQPPMYGMYPPQMQPQQMMPQYGQPMYQNPPYAPPTYMGAPMAPMGLTQNGFYAG